MPRQFHEICLYFNRGLTGSLEFPLADLTPGHSVSEFAGLQSLRDRPGKHCSLVDGGEPERELIGEVVTGSPGSVAFNERSGPEVFETGAWA